MDIEKMPELWLPIVIGIMFLAAILATDWAVKIIGLHRKDGGRQDQEQSDNAK